MLLYELLALQLPYTDMNEAQISEYVRLGVPPTLPPAVYDDPGFKPLLNLHLACISLNPSERPDATRVKQLLIDMKL